jgi:hypothetical protein
MANFVVLFSRVINPRASFLLLSCIFYCLAAMLVFAPVAAILASHLYGSMI